MKEKIIYVSDNGLYSDSSPERVLNYENKLKEELIRAEEASKKIKNYIIKSFIHRNTTYYVVQLKDNSEATINKFIKILKEKYADCYVNINNLTSKIENNKIIFIYDCEYCEPEIDFYALSTIKRFIIDDIEECERVLYYFSEFEDNE